MSIPLTDSLRQEYQSLFDTCEIRPERLATVDQSLVVIVPNRGRYEAVGTPLGIPWYFIAAIHTMESSLSFTRHLLNGDPLTGRTVHVPQGRPVTGQPPFTWEESATDAMTFQHLNEVTDWTLPGSLYQIEKYNGLGYRTLHPEVLTPYLWGGSNHYTAGKYVADGTFHPDAVSQQCGAALILRRIVDTGVISFGASDTSSVPSADSIAALGADVAYSTTERSDAAQTLQQALNQLPGVTLQADGFPGPATSDAFRKVTGGFLSGDPRGQAQAVGN